VTFSNCQGGQFQTKNLYLDLVKISIFEFVMGKKKKEAKLIKSRLKELDSKKCKTKCCEKYKKGEHKRCKRCPCFDLLKKVA